MRQHGPHIAKILARQAISEAQHLHARVGVVGFDIAGPESGNPPRLFKSAYEIARLGQLGLTVHAGEDAPVDYVWEAVDRLGAQRIGHGCAAVQDPELMRRLARDGIVVECCLSSNYHTGAIARGAPHPIRRFLEAGVPVTAVRYLGAIHDFVLLNPIAQSLPTRAALAQATAALRAAFAR